MEHTSTPSAETLLLTYISYHCQDRVGYITLNRPEKRNALSDVVVKELNQAFDYAEDDENCKVIVLRATGPVFCAGADLRYLQQMQHNNYQENLEDSTLFLHLLYQIYTLKKVVIAQVQGHAIAGGCALATVCDFTFTVEAARFGYTEVKFGFLPAIVKVFLLKRIGEARAKELLLTGDLISAEKAKAYGLVNEVVAENQLEARVQELAQRLCVQNSAQAMEGTKELFALLQELPLKEALDYAAERNALARATDDSQTGIEAFLKNEPILW
ncbi:enoyl-CoA hydratase/isomerase family protein [Rufibacter glacialis]|uniref:Enoyl-CoA hydratase/isomerase family protein n=1 Tax=Rufibacter glacialis TaxID=1259555 RepID=A0A5M8QBT0_9BACT|nr:enoyl-CoA hydratase/isomerase family protein [Rufibacter glacialis]KAA6432276.1 enoyl-CoA hydratase/isomerase family protein [Rufibacter glacialis]GGK77357.1 enoyl-CoA hydratase [Rufibacter glacialis]